MASPNPETSEIRRKGRQRLIGAVTIVLLLVVFVPMVLDPQPRQDSKDAMLAIPPKEGAAPLPTPAAPAKAPEAAAPKAPEAPAAKAPPTANLEAKSSPPPKTPAATAPAPAPAAAPKLEGFAVQVGAFGDEERLRQAREKLAGARITHFIERLPSGLTRLRAGPYPTREAADKALASVQAAGLDGKVVALP